MIHPHFQGSSSIEEVREQDREERPELRLFLRMPQSEEQKLPPSRLARALGLHLYSKALLGKRARIEMNFAAVILLVVSAFELIAWSFLFNAIFNSDILYRGMGTIPAVAMASLFAAAVFWFERQFLTCDELRREEAKRAAGIRLGFILAAALVTAQPLELLFFREPVQKRVHEEGIRQEAVRRLNALLEGEARNDKYLARKSDRKVESQKNAQAQLEEEVKRRGSLDLQLRSKEGDLASLRREVEWRRQERDQARRGRSPEAAREAERAYRSADARRAAVAREIEQVRLQLAQTDAILNELRGQVSRAEEAIDAVDESFQEKEETLDSRLRAWIDQLQESEPAEEVVEKPARLAGAVAGDEGPWRYEDPEYDFFEQLRVVWDLITGRPPRWLNATPESRKNLESHYGFRPAGLGDGWQWHLLMAVFACHLIALFIPLLVLTIKTFLMPQELRSYYSGRHQAEAGDVDAWLALLVEEKVKGKM